MLASMHRPGCIVRSTLASLGALFLPLSIWFGFGKRHHYWMESIGLFVAGVGFLYLALSRESALLQAIDDLSGPANPDA